MGAAQQKITRKAQPPIASGEHEKIGPTRDRDQDHSRRAIEMDSVNVERQPVRIRAALLKINRIVT
jgi:hypothetical protein